MRSGTELSQFLRLFRPTFDFGIINCFVFRLVTFPVLPLTGFTFFNLFDLLECLVM